LGLQTRQGLLSLDSLLVSLFDSFVIKLGRFDYFLQLGLALSLNFSFFKASAML
jgi:hypothetical protein